jgi:hypothetical protein
MALQSLAVHWHVMTLSPHLTPTRLPEDMCRVRALRREFARRLRKWLLRAARDRTRWRLPPAASTGEEEQGIPVCASPSPDSALREGPLRRRPCVRSAWAGAVEGRQATCTQVAGDRDEDVQRGGESLVTRPGSQGLRVLEQMARVIVRRCLRH